MKGVTLIELLLVILILAILASLGYTSFMGWSFKQRIERDTRNIYSEIMSVRTKSFTEKMVCGIYWSNKPFKSIEVRCDNDSDGSIISGYMELGTIELSTTFDSNFDHNYLRFTKEGFAMDWGTIYSAETGANPEYNCIAVSFARIKIGHWNGTDCEIR